MPDNTLLSHDLFEGLHARTALVTDVEVVDDYPSSVLATPAANTAGLAAIGRYFAGCCPSCRRARGSKRNRLPLIARWKIFDNLRRSVLAPG
jgi:cyclic beta-1,2-glucan synthetase